MSSPPPELPSTVTNENRSKKAGRPFTDIWEGHMIKGSLQSKGHYSATCNYCGQSWKQGKPLVLREHLANRCKICPKEIAAHYAKIVGKIIGEKDNENNENSEEGLNENSDDDNDDPCNEPPTFSFSYVDVLT